MQTGEAGNYTVNM